MQMVQICDGIGDAGKNRKAWQLSIRGEVCSAVQHQSGRHIVRRSVKQRHGRWGCRVLPAESCNLPRVPPLPSQGAGIRERREVCAVKSAQPRSSCKLLSFVDVEVMLAKVLA